jgi:chromosome segregation ATPase
LERQTSYTLEQKLKSFQRDASLEAQQLKLKLQVEQEKNLELEKLLNSLSDADSTLLQIQNSVLTSKLNGLEKDYEELKGKLFEDFSNKASHINSLAETNQVLEEELKSFQELSLSKNKAQSQKVFDLEEMVRQVAKRNEELLDQIARQAESFEEEIDHLRHDLETSQSSLEIKKKDLIRTSEKLSEERSLNEKLRIDLSDLEEKLRTMENENDQLLKDISTREKKIKSLSQDLNTMNEDIQDTKDHEIEKLSREVLILTKSLKSSKENILTLTSSKDELQDKISELRAEMQKKGDQAEKDKKSLNDSNFLLKQKIEQLEKSFETKEENLRKAKDEIIQDLQDRLLALKQEKVDLENTLQELQDQIQVSRVSFGNEVSLNDELAQLRESYNSRCSTPRNMTLEMKKSEKLHGEMSEKELQIQILKAENNSLKNQMENLVPTLLSKHPEHQTLLAEKKRLESEFALAKECWANENSNLRNLIEETEAIAINANLRYAQAATDRDLYYKMFLDFKKNNTKKSWFKKNK